MSKAVLDASALLALLGEESGARRVAEAIPGAAFSAVNLSEVIAKLVDRGMPEEGIRSALDGLGLDVREFGREAAFQAARLRRATSGLKLSLADRACLALGVSLGRPVLTTDRQWSQLRLGIKVVVVR